MEDRLPEFILKKLKQSPTSSSKSLSRTNDILGGLSVQKREILAKEALLSGFNSLKFHSKSKASNRDRSTFDYDFALSFAHQNRHMALNSKFLQLNSSTAPIEFVTMKHIKTEYKDKLKQNKLSQKTYNSRNHIVVTDPAQLFVNNNHSSETRLATAKSAVIAKTVNQYRKISNDSAVAKIKSSRDASVDLKIQYIESVRKKQDIVKRVAEFKRKIAERLESTKNKNSHLIMKCIDDSLIHEFMERYKGNAMTIDAVIHHMVTSLERASKEASESLKADNLFDAVNNTEDPIGN